MLGSIGWTPTQAEEANLDTGSAAATENIQPEALTEDSNILQYVDEEAFQSRDHVTRLREEERHNTYVFLNRDGTKTVYYMGQDVKYTDKNGQIREKDTTLVRGDGGYGMRDNDVLVHIPDAAHSGIRLRHQEKGIVLTPQGGSGNGALADNSITYQNYFGRGIHLRYTPMLSGVKEDIILTKYTGQNSFTFTLETDGLYLYESEGQYYLAESEDAEAAFYLGEILVYDAMGKPDLGTMAVETVVPGQTYTLTVSADMDFLTDPETRYPVTIDPTVTVSYNTYGDGAIEDAPVFENYPTRNYANYVYNSMGYVDETFGMSKTAVRLTALLADAAYVQLSAEQITDVQYYVKCAGGNYANINIHALTENSTWAENTVTWNNIGAHSETIYATESVGGNAWDSFDITALVKEWKNGTQNPQCGLVMVSESTTIRTSTLSSEYSNADYKPYVVFTYNNAITIDPIETEIYVGETTTLTVSTIPSGQAVTWTSDTPNVATVENGEVTGVSAGTAIITAELQDGTSAECGVTVKNLTQITLNYTKIDILEGGEFLDLSATVTPNDQEVTWSSSNTSVATVSPSGDIIGVKAGQATITARTEDGTTASCTVYVVLEDGIYYIQNMSSTLFLHVKNGGIANNTTVCQQNKYSPDTTDLERVRQMWKICYIGNGCYSVRPLHKMDMALHVNGFYVDIYNIGTSDVLNTISAQSRWIIEWYSSGYLFKNASQQTLLTTFSMQVNNNSMEADAIIISGNDSAPYLRSRWTLDQIDIPPVGVILYDIESGLAVQDVHRYITPEAPTELSDLGLEIETYPQIYCDDSFNWYTLSSRVQVNLDTGEITGIAPGLCSVQGFGEINGQRLSIEIGVTVTAIPNGTYLWHYSNTDTYVEIMGENRASGAFIGQDEIKAYAEQQWIFQHTGDGYYTIRSVYPSTGGYLCISNDEETGNMYMTTCLNEESGSAKWEISRGQNGCYIISQKVNAYTELYCSCSEEYLDDYELRLEEKTSGETDSYIWSLIRIGFITEAECEAQIRKDSCGPASVQMFMEHYFPSFGEQDYRQNQSWGYSYLRGNLKPEKDDDGTIIYPAYLSDLKTLIDYFLTTMEDTTLDVTYVEEQIYTEETVLNFLNDGHIMIINRQYCKLNASGTVLFDGGHYFVLAGYVYVEDEVQFVIYDPLPEGLGKVSLLSYEELCYQIVNNSEWDAYWWGSLVVSTHYADETIPWYLD